MLHWSWVTSFGQKQNCWLCDKQCRERGDQEPGLWNPFLPFDETAQLKLERTTTTTTQTFAVFTFRWIGTRCSTDWRQHPHSRKKAAKSYPTVWLSPQGPTGESVSPLLMQFFERIGLPCRHQIHVLHYHMTPSWTGLSHQWHHHGQVYHIIMCPYSGGQLICSFINLLMLSISRFVMH